MFSFEKLIVWEKSIELLRIFDEKIDLSKIKGDSELKSQIKRSILSISTNIAEGTGRTRTKDKKRFFSIAKGSAYETVSLLFVIKMKKYCTDQEFMEIYNICDGISGMLHSIIKSKHYKGLD